jgi:hypothetical protein
MNKRVHKKYIEVGKCRTSDNMHCIFYDANETSTIKNKESAFCIKTGQSVNADFWCSLYLGVTIKEGH